VQLLKMPVGMNDVDEGPWRRCSDRLHPIPGSHQDLRLLPARATATSEREAAPVVREQCLAFRAVVADVLVVGDDDPAPCADFGQPDIVMLVVGEVVSVTLTASPSSLNACGSFLPQVRSKKTVSTSGGGCDVYTLEGQCLLNL
jgi:hypothetical protein